MRGSRRALGALLLGGLALSPLHSATVPVSQAIGTCTTANPNPNPNPASFAAAGDFNGDCKSDLLWQNSSSGEVFLWFMNGTTFGSSGSIGSPTFDWVIEGVGDFNGDGKADILWRNSSTGEVYLWITSGTTFPIGESLGYVSPEWSIAGVGDFDGDGKADILWRDNTTGQVYLWLMNGTTIAGGGSVSYVSSDWVIQGTGDFNGDGDADILWRNSTTGQVYLWLMNGTTIASTGSPGTPTFDWSIAGVGDFDGDGKSDLLWRNNTTGEAYIWFMNGTVTASSGSLGYIPSAWVIQGVGDYDGSGRAGILWRNSTTEQVYIWLMNGTTLTSSGSPGTPDNTWQIANGVQGTPTTTPVVVSVSPNSVAAGAANTQIEVFGTGFTFNSVVQWNGTALPTGQFYYSSGLGLYATVPAADLTTPGAGSVTVSTPNAFPSLSNAVTVTITSPPVPTVTELYPSGGPINTAASIYIYGNGFTSGSIVAVNGETVPSTVVYASEIAATIPAATLAFPGNFNITVTTPGGTSTPMGFTTFISIANNDIIYNPADGLLYASVPPEAVGGPGNSVVGIDPTTGNIARTIFAGSNPDKMALSTDGTQLFVALDGAGGVAQVNLVIGSVVNQFPVGSVSPYSNQKTYLAAVPGMPNSVAVASTPATGSQVTIYDSGVARANTSLSLNYGEGPLSFGSSASTLYMDGYPGVVSMTVGPTGITGGTTLDANAGGNLISLQYDNGQIYLSSGQVLNASTGAVAGTFYNTPTSAANGPIVSDSTLGRAFMAISSYIDGAYELLAFDETTFTQLGSIPVNDVGTNGYSTTFEKIVRWGQNGLAVSAAPSVFSSVGQIFIFQAPLVKDLSSSPADLSVSLTAPATATTGTAINWVATVSNLGPNAAQDATLALNLDSSLIINSITASQGSCGTGAAFSCDLGSVANGGSATVTVSATPTNAATLAGIGSVTSVSYDPILTNNQATTSTTVTGSEYGATPTIASISPNLVQAGSAAFTLTVNGAGFNPNSTVNLGTTALTTSYVSPTQLTANVTAGEVANYGWEAVTVSNPMPGGGLSQIAPLTIYDLVGVTASGMLYDPWGQTLYVTVPGTVDYGNTILPVNPVTGAVGTTVVVGSEPTVMAETSDGNYLYISLTGSYSVAQFNLLNQSLVTTIILGTTATSMAAMPGTDSTLAMTINNVWDPFGIFDISGSNGTFRTNLSGYSGAENPEFPDASHVYAAFGNTFYRYSVNAAGLTLIDSTTLQDLAGYNGQFQVANGLIYGGDGGIINPNPTPPVQIATLPAIELPGSVEAGEVEGSVADPSLQKQFLMFNNFGGSTAYDLVRYDLTSYLPESALALPSSLATIGSNWTMVRYGQDGIALLTTTAYNGNGPDTLLVLLRGPFVAPQELGTDPPAALTSSSASTITHGAGNTMLTLTGSNFLPGVAVTWNGSYRTTTIVDANHVNVAIPASDLTNTGTGSLVATNPGASASNTLQITIN
jgi:hypothetical protein